MLSAEHGGDPAPSERRRRGRVGLGMLCGALCAGLATPAVPAESEAWEAACEAHLVLHDSDWLDSTYPRDPQDKRKRIVPPGTLVDVNPHPKDIARDLGGVTTLVVSRTDSKKLAAFPAVPDLEEIVVWSSKVDSLAFLANYPALDRLAISGSSKAVDLGEAGAWVARLGLTALAFDGTALSGALATADAGTLRFLNLRDAPFAPDAAADLSGFAALECLSLAGQTGPTELTLPAAGTLRYLDLGGSDLRLLRGLEGLRSVEVLLLHETSGLDGFSLPLGPDSRLRRLSLAKADVAGLAGLDTVGTLQVLNLAAARNLAAAALPSSLPRMSSFEVQWTGWTGLAALDAPALEHLGVDVAELADLAVLDRFPKLQSIELGGAPAGLPLIEALADRGLRQISGVILADHLEAIQQIDGYDLCNYSLAGWFSIARAGEDCPAWTWWNEP